MNNLFKTTPLEHVHFQGPIEQCLQKFVYHRMESEEAVNVVYQEAEDAFKNKVDDESGIIGLWQGEFWGKLMLSACRVCRYKHSAFLKDFLHRAALKLITYQDADGYLGTYRNSAMVLPADREKAKAIMGFSCNWVWNIWCRKYTLWGLLEIYELTEDKTILDACVRFADHLIDQLAKLGLRLSQTGTFNGLPSMSIIKPMIVLARLTGNQRYLQFAVDAAEDWDNADNRPPNLIANARKNIPVHEWYPESQTWAKAYEMMSCLDGLLELYRATGTQKYFDAVKTIQALLKEHELNQLKSVGYNDIFAHAAFQINSISEPCDAVHWMRLNYELFMLTGEAKYVDDFEAVFLNAFMASVYRDGTWGGRGVRSHGRQFTAFKQAGFVHNHCCVNNLPRGFMNAAQLAVTVTADNALYVNLFTEFHASLESFDVTIGGSYLRHGYVTVDITSHLDKPAEVAFRIPSWSPVTTIVSPDGKQATKEAGYCRLQLLPNATTRFELQFDMTPVIHEFKVPVVPVTPPDFRAVRWANLGDKRSEVPYELLLDKPKDTITVGPLVMARSKDIGSSEAEMFGPDTIHGMNAVCSAVPLLMPNTLAAFTATINGVQTPVCDYASAANDVFMDDRHFSIFF